MLLRIDDKATPKPNLTNALQFPPLGLAISFLESIEFTNRLASSHRLNVNDLTEYLEKHLTIISELRGEPALDMGEPVRIFDMAKDMITLFGLKPFDDIDIVSTGMRPGEKVFEELNTEGEHMAKTRHPKIIIGTINTYDDRVVVGALGKFEALAVLGREGELRRFFNQFLPEARVTE